MRLASFYGNARTGGRVPSPIANGDVEGAVHHDKMLFFVFVDVKWHAVVRIGDNLNDGIGSPIVCAEVTRILNRSPGVTCSQVSSAWSHAVLRSIVLLLDILILHSGCVG